MTSSMSGCPLPWKCCRTWSPKLNGGLVGGRLYVLGGIPSSGKTVLVNNIADNICIFDHPVLFFSYDDGRDRASLQDLLSFQRLRHRAVQSKAARPLRSGSDLQKPSIGTNQHE